MRDMNYCLFMCRVDHLAMVNQAYSIQVGDTYLKSLSKMLLGELGDNGVIYRLSGDVFMIAEQWKGETNALDFAERLKDLVGTFTINANGYSVRQSISIGIAKLAINQDLNEALNLCQRAWTQPAKRAKAKFKSPMTISSDCWMHKAHSSHKKMLKQHWRIMNSNSACSP
jgi:diguanylate cyclase (GGDEF)-like protein